MVALQNLSSLQRVADHLRVGRDSDISACSFNFGFADGDDELLVHNLGVNVELDTVHHLVLKHHNGVIITDGSLEQATAVLNVPRADNLEAWDGGVPGSKALSVLGTDASANAVNAAEGNWTSQVTSRHVERLSSGVDDVVNSLQREIERHELDDRAQAVETSADGNSGESSLTNWSVPDALRTVAVPHTLRHLIGTIVLGDFFADEEDVGVALDFVAHGAVDGLAH